MDLLVNNDQTTLQDFSHPKENSPSPKDQVKNEPEDKKTTGQKGRGRRRDKEDQR